MLTSRPGPQQGRNGSVGIGVLGAGSTVARLAVLPAITTSGRAHVAASASLSGPVPEPWAQTAVATYQAVIDHPEVDAVYLPLPNGMHEHWAVRAAAAGKHVLCEKPIASTAAVAQRMHQACNAAGVVLAEAWMTPFDPRWSETLRLAETGFVGDIVEVRATFTFTIGPEAADNYRWDRAQGGGALLDVGIYCLGPAARLWGTDPETIEAVIEAANESTAGPLSAGVDASTAATLTWADGRRCEIRCSFVDDEHQRLELIGTRGALLLDSDAHTGGLGAQHITHREIDGTTSTRSVAPGNPYLAMVDAFADAVTGVAPWNRSVAESIELLALIERIRDAA